jgi:hypothetical protein
MQAMVPIISGVERPGGLGFSYPTQNRDDPYEGKDLPLEFGLGVDSIRGEIDKESGYDGAPWLTDEAIQYLAENYPNSFTDPNDSNFAAREYVRALDRGSYNFTGDAAPEDRKRLEMERTERYLMNGPREDIDPMEAEFFSNLSRKVDMQKQTHQIARERFNKPWPYGHKTRADRIADNRTDSFRSGEHPLSRHFGKSASKPTAAFDWNSVFNQYDPADYFRQASGENSQLSPEILEYINRQ